MDFQKQATGNGRLFSFFGQLERMIHDRLQNKVAKPKLIQMSTPRQDCGGRRINKNEVDYAVLTRIHIPLKSDSSKLESTFRITDDVIRKEAGCSTIK